MSAFPRTSIEGLSVPRMIIGTNWFLGFSHTSKAQDDFLKRTQTPKRIADVMEVFLGAGIDAVMAQGQDPRLQEAIKHAEDRTGQKLILLSTPHLPNLGDDPQAMGEVERLFDAEAAIGASVCMPHQCSTDALLDRRSRTIRNMDRYCAMMRERGLIPGLSTHMPEAIGYADATNLDVGIYIQLYNAIGFLMQVEVDWVHGIIQNAAKPVIAIKPMAAGRLQPLPGLAFAWSTLRDRDMVCVGTMTPDEAREVIDISLALLEKRRPTVELQRTRSKSSIEAPK
ncbi:MAG TPA: hypothetical protein VMZ50_11395 [Phycisphaerae bacterium]|nr:hypothetical protein [Phycisphaerae bacterium]